MDNDGGNVDSTDNMDSMVLVYNMDNKVGVHLLNYKGFQQYIDLQDEKNVVPWKYLLSVLTYVKTDYTG